ncbi:MAG: ABC transporter permease [Actinomycetaceae bacterium]|nr:ABC transporter permease [Actinomycetaceae bacterium]
MNDILRIAHKELVRFFAHKSALITLILPGALIFLMYSFMGYMTSDDDVSYDVAVAHMPEELRPYVQGFSVHVADEKSVATKNTIKADIDNEAYDALVIFPSDFTSALKEAQEGRSNTPVNISVYYNSADENSSAAYALCEQWITSFESHMYKIISINSDVNTSYDVASDDERTSSFLGSMMPVLLIVLIVAGIMQLASESIVSEKERGTLATLLVAPIDRFSIVAGKMLGLGVLAIVLALFTFIGVMSGISSLFAGNDASFSFDSLPYSTADYVYVCLILLTVSLLCLALFLFLSALAHTVKEAQMLGMLVYIPAFAFSFSTMDDASGAPLWHCCVPFMGSAESLRDVLSLEPSATFILMACVMNLVYAAIVVFGVRFALNKERFTFSS